MRKIIVSLLVSLGVLVSWADSVNASPLADKKTCNVYKGSMVYKRVKHGSTYTFDNGNTEQCDNGEWILVTQGSRSRSSKSDTAVAIRCTDYRSIAGCVVTWSSGRRTQANEYAPRSGPVVGGTQWLEAFGTRVCADLYRNGGIRTYYC